MLLSYSLIGIWKLLIITFNFEFKYCYKINNLIYNNDIKYNKPFSFSIRSDADKLIELDTTNIYNHIKLTGKRVDITWKENIQPIKFKSEEKIKNILIKKGEYIAGILLSEQRINEINEVCSKENITLIQALSLRKQLLTNKILNQNQKLQYQEAFIYKSYNQGVSILKLSTMTDLPAVAIFRFIIDKRIRKYYTILKEKEIKNIVKWALRFGNSSLVPSVDDTTMKINNIDIPISLSLLNEVELIDGIAKTNVLNILQEEKFWINIINSRDMKELAIAKSIDQVSYNEMYLNEKENSLAWENCLYDYLNQYNISYLTENDMRSIPNCNITPDVLFLDDCYINGMLIRWMDCKSYYGSTQSKLFNSKLTKQISRYNKELLVQDQGGYGSIIYRLGYSDQMKDRYSNDVLFLDPGSLPLSDFALEME